MTTSLARSPRIRRASLASLIAAIAVGVAIRIALAFAANGKSWSDSAVIALMAIHALGGKFYTFYWGQAYMGSLESLGVAPFFALFGVNDVTLSMGLLPWYVVFAIALSGVARRCGGELGGALAPWLLAVAPPYVQYQQITPRGDYPETLMLGTILLWLVLRVTYDGLSADSERRHLNAIAFVAGVAFWTNWLVFPYFVVAGVYLWLHDRWLPFRPAVVAMLAFFVLGSLPFWIYNIRNGFPTFSFVSDVQTAEGRALAFAFALREAIPMLLGFRDLEGRFVFGWLGAALTAGATLAALALVIGLRRSWWALLRGRVRDSEPIIAMLLLLVAMVAIYSVGLPGRFHVPRYLLPIVTATLVLLSAAIAWLMARSRPLGIIAFGGLVLLYGVQIVGLALGFSRSQERPGAIGPVDKLADALLQAGVRFGYADYADATITTYLTRRPSGAHRLRRCALPARRSGFSRPGGHRARRRAPGRDHARRLERRKLVAARPGLHHLLADPLRRRAARADAARRVEGHDERGRRRRLRTFWMAIPGRTGRFPPKSARPSITLDLGRLATVNGVFLDGGERDHDGFVKLLVESSRDGTTGIR